MSVLFFRFINTIEVNKLDYETVSEFVKRVRTRYYLENRKIASCYSSFQKEFEEELVTAFSNLVMPGSEVTEEILNVKEDVLRFGGQMFIYLITCPTENAKLFKRIFQQQVSGIFISMKKIVENSSNQDMVDVGKRVLNELMTTFEFQYVTNIDNSTFWKKGNLAEIKGTIYKGFTHWQCLVSCLDKDKYSSI